MPQRGLHPLQGARGRVEASSCPGTSAEQRSSLPQALLNSSHKYIEAKESFKHHGIIVDNVSYDLEAIMKQKEDTVSGLTKGIEGLLKKNKVRGGVCALQRELIAAPAPPRLQLVFVMCIQLQAYQELPAS